MAQTAFTRAGEAQFFDVLQGLRGAGVYGVERAVAEGGGDDKQGAAGG